MPALLRPHLKPLAATLLVSAALTLSACATNPMTTGSIGNASAAVPVDGRAQALADLGAQFKRNPGDKNVLIAYSAGLRASGRADQAVAVLEQGMKNNEPDPQIRVAYAKALAAAGQFQQALNVIDDAIDPAAPDWNALSVKGAILDQSGDNAGARAVYMQALRIAPNQPSIHANLGLSYSMSNDLANAEKELRIAAKLPGSTSVIRQDLALVLGLQGRFDEAKAILAAELPPDKVDANMAYIKGMLTQQNRWDLIKKAG